MHPHDTSPSRLRPSAWLCRWPRAQRGPVLARLGVLGLVLWATAGLAQAHPDPVPASRPHPLAESLTQDLVALSTRYQLAGPAEQAQLLSTLLTVATERQQLLAALVEEDPGEVLRVALPADLRAGLPDEVQALVEEEVESEGELEILHEDWESGSRYRYFLKTAGGRFVLHFAANPPTHLLTGDQVHVKGIRVDGALALTSGDTSIETLALYSSSTSTATTATTTTSGVLPNTFGAQKTLVILVNFQDNTAQPWILAQVQSAVFGSSGASGFFLEASYGQTWLSGDVYGWYTLPLSSTTCDTAQIATDANNAATASGVNLAAYARFVYVFPYNSICGWTGVATIGGNPSQAWVNGGGTTTNTLDVGTFAHELGHNFGLYHSHGLDCGPVTLSGQCTVWEYFDTLDTMGWGAGHFNAFQKERLGWLNYGVSSPPLTTVTASGTYTLTPYESKDLNPKALKILKFTNPTTGLSYFYYLEYRQPLGFDTYVYQTNGVVVHLAEPGAPNSSDLLDMTPNSGIYTDWYDVPLVVGASYFDPDAGVAITTTSASGSSASVSVSLSPPSCVRALPTISLSPSQATALAGTTVNYTVSLRNNDSSSCGASTFNLQATVPYGGWTGNLSSAQLTLSPGASSSTSLPVTSAANSVNGPDPIVVTATNIADLVYGGSATATYVVGTPLSVTVSTDQATYTQTQSVTITTTVTSGGSPVSSASVALTINVPDGSSLQASLVTGSNGQASYVLKLSHKSPKGTYVASAVASTAASSASGSTMFQVQ